MDGTFEIVYSDMSDAHRGSAHCGMTLASMVHALVSPVSC